MADIVTGTVSGMVDVSGLVRDHADIRRENAVEAGDLKRDIASEAHNITDSIFGATAGVARDAAANSLAAASDATKYFIASTQAATQTAKEQAAAEGYTTAKVESGFAKAAGDTAYAAQLVQGQASVEGERTRGAMAVQHGVLTTQISNARDLAAVEAERTRGAMSVQHGILALQVANDGAATRSLMLTNKIDDLNRAMIERNAEIVEMKGDKRYHDHEFRALDRSMQQNQWSSLQSQLQAFNSDLQTTKQGVVNFGSMTGNAGRQTSTNNIV